MPKLSDQERKQARREYQRQYKAQRRQDPEYRKKAAERTKKWREANPDEQLKRNYGITREERDALFAAQGFKCAVCRTDDPGAKRDWNVDHCHSTGRVRGVLCHNCNVALGLLHDNKQTLANAILYLN